MGQIGNIRPVFFTKFKAPLFEGDAIKVLDWFEYQAGINRKPELLKQTEHLGNSVEDTIEKIKVISIGLGLEVDIGFLLQVAMINATDSDNR